MRYFFIYPQNLFYLSSVYFIVLFFQVFFWVFFSFFDTRSNSLKHCYLFSSILFWHFLKGEMHIYTFFFFLITSQDSFISTCFVLLTIGKCRKKYTDVFPGMAHKKMSIIATNMRANSHLCPKVKRSFFKKSTHKKQINALVLSWSYFKGKQRTGKKRLI